MWPRRWQGFLGGGGGGGGTDVTCVAIAGPSSHCLDRPATAAVVAAPMRNEWLAKAAGSTPAPRMRERRWSVKAGRVRKAPSWNWKRGAGGICVVQRQGRLWCG